MRVYTYMTMYQLCSACFICIYVFMNITNFSPWTFTLNIFVHDSYENLKVIPYLQMIQIWKGELIQGKQNQKSNDCGKGTVWGN